MLIKTVSAALTLGVILAKAISKTDLFLLLILPISFGLVAFSLNATSELTTLNLGSGLLILNIITGLLIGLVLSLPILAIDFFTYVIRSLFKQPLSSLSLASSLGFFIILSDLDYFTYFFSLLVKSSKLDTSNFNAFLSSHFYMELPNIGTSIFSALVYFVLPLLAVMLTLYLFFAFAKTSLPTIVSPGLKESLKVVFVFCALVFVFSSSSIYFYDLMHDLSNQVLRQ